MKSIARSIPATSRTALAILASISLLLSLLVAAGPASAIDGAQLNPSHVGTSWDDSEQNANCSEEDLDLIAEGEVLWHFVLTQPSGDEAILTAEFETEGTVMVEDADKPSTTLHFYVVTGPDTLLGASTDISGGNLNLSHICNKVTEEEEDEGSLKVLKVDEDDNPLAGAEFTVEGQPGTFITDENGEFCITGLPIGEVLTVTEIAPPDGYEIVGEASQEVPVDADGDCASPEATFVNRLEEGGEDEGSLKVLKVDEDDNPLAGAEFTVEGQTGTFVTDENGEFCITGLPIGEVLTVTEIAPPDGYEIVGEASQEVPVDADGDCASPEATFVNRLEEGGEESGSLEIRKETDPDGSDDPFAFEASYDPGEFALTDGDAFGPTELALGDYTVSELLTEAQADAGWSLTAIDCTDDGDAVVDLDAGTVTVTVDDGDAIVCTFENELSDEGTLGGTPRATPREGTQGGLPNTATPSPGSGSPLPIVIALAMLFGLSVTTLAAARARAR